MASGNEQRSLCQRCGSPILAGDRFCGVCGARVAPVTGEDTQVIPRPVAASQASAARSGGRPLLLAGVLGALAVLLLDGGALALVGSGFGGSLLGGSEQDPPPPREERGVAPSQPEITQDPDVSPEPTEQTDESGTAEPTSAPPLLVTSTSEPTTSTDSYAQSTEEMEAEAEEAAGDYYRAAGSEDWAYTYENLDSGTRSRFTWEEWSEKNQWFADNGSVIYHIESVEHLDGTERPTVEVSLRLTYDDGSSSTRATYFVYEDGEWKHAFGREEYDLFMPNLSYEEFVEAQG